MYNIIRDRRKILNITQQELAELSGVSLRMIKSIELGSGNPSIKTIKSILDVLGLEITIKIKEVNNEAGTSIL